MSEIHKSYRIHTNVGTSNSEEYLTINTNLIQDYDTFDILSVKINSSDTYKLHNSNYGVVVGRVLANNGFGVPNAKLSIFIESDTSDGEKVREIYPFTSPLSKNNEGVRYNLLPDENVGDCHQIVGTFPNKRYMLDNDVILEVFDKYYKYTTRTNNSGDYIIMGVPVGTHTLHMDLDLSDCGILSQRPRDFVYKGYTVEQFENPNMFKSGTEYESLSQVFTQNQVVNVQPFWGNESLGETIGITRADINVSFTFQPTCVFMGSVASDKSSDGITKKCMATENMGNMEEMTTGEGTIEMIRKTPGGDIEEFQVRGTQLINANGVWCYQIPMNLDYMMTDEYGNMVPTDDPSKGIPTRCSVRFRISMQDNEENVDNYFRCKVLVPHNPQNLPGGTYEDYDYEFGSKTRDDSFRDLFWNNVYTVKSYIPRFQKRKVRGWRDKRFTGIKSCNFAGTNNPIPYNNIRIKLPLMFTILCAIIKCFIFLTGIFNTLISALGNFMAHLGRRITLDLGIFGEYELFSLFPAAYKAALELKLNVLSEGLCPDLENWFFAPMLKNNLKQNYNPPKGVQRYNLLRQTLNHLMSDNAYDDEKSIEYENKEAEEDIICLTINVDYLIACVEMNLAMEYKVINFDFYNDWINGFIYIPRFMRYLRPKKTFLGITFAKAKIKGCMDDSKTFAKTRRFTQQCSLGYNQTSVNGYQIFSNVENPLAKSNNKKAIKRANNLHKSRGFTQSTIFGRKAGICHEHTTSKKQYVYYMKPCEWKNTSFANNVKTNLFATDIVLLGSLNDCDLNGIPQAFKYLSSTSYIMPTNLALTNMETNGPLYANDRGTICAGSSDQIPEDSSMLNKESDGIKVIPVEDGLTGEIKFYRDAKDINIDTEYEGNELSDIIALTEAAGISWDYTGPGQGKVNPKNLYYPGGHFLGLTCVNSQTNIKSCINLERICEVGANFSQRKEDIRRVDSNGREYYVYTAPTGFISGDDIVAEDFRTMFSTMNQTRLIASKTNPLTGYKMYDFKYSHPVNFDGSFKNVVKKGIEYNTDIEIPKEENGVFNDIGINTNNNERPDADPMERNYTQTRTIEDTSLDYYLFRMGLDKDSVKGGSKSDLQKRKFLINKDNKYFLPQYENSYYFYFGMKSGASAIDELNKQFFSKCNISEIGFGEPSLEINKKDINICEGKQDIELVINNLEMPYNKIYYTKEGVVEKVSGDNTPEIDDDIFELIIHDIVGEKQSSLIKINDLTFGEYTFTIIDAEGLKISKTINLGDDVLSGVIKPHDFNKSIGKNNGFTKNIDIFNGGYIEVTDFIINEKYSENITEKRVLVKDTNGNSGSTSIKTESTDDMFLTVPSSNTIYDIYLSYRCKNGGWVDIYQTSYIMKDGSSISLNMGWKGLSFYLTVGTDTTGSDSKLKYGDSGWWMKIDNYNSNDDIINDWVKKVCLFKESTSDETFSNNIFALNGEKVIWGNPQNEKEVKSDIFTSSEESSDDYEGYTLDDDYSYYPTWYGKLSKKDKYKSYNAVAVNGTSVGGDYWATLSGDKCEWIPNRLFPNNIGYVFKPLPEGDLQYHVYNGNSLSYNKYVLNDGTATNVKPDGVEGIDFDVITKGVFYPSFIYPVIDAPFNASVDFYVWEKKLVVYDESYGLPQYISEERCGRSEATVTNGITFDGRYSTFKIDNIKISEGSNELQKEDNLIITGVGSIWSGIGMDVDVSVLDNEEETTTNYQSAKKQDGTRNYAEGFSGIKEFNIELTEGIPTNAKDVNDEPIETNVLENYVNSINNQISLDGLFRQSITYESYTDTKNTFLTFSTNKKNVTFCYQKSMKTGNVLLFKNLTNSEKYIYGRTGGKNQPKYYVLSMYNENAINDKLNELCFITIDYKSRRKMYYSVPYTNDEGEIVYETGKITGSSVRQNRGNLYGIMNIIGNRITKATPIQNASINASSIEWLKILDDDSKNVKFENGVWRIDNNTDIVKNGILYAYEKYEHPSINGSEINTYKIFPVILPEVIDREGGDIIITSGNTPTYSETDDTLSFIEIADKGTTGVTETRSFNVTYFTTDGYGLTVKDNLGNVSESFNFNNTGMLLTKDDTGWYDLKIKEWSSVTVSYEEEDGTVVNESACTANMELSCVLDNKINNTILSFYLQNINQEKTETKLLLSKDGIYSTLPENGGESEEEEKTYNISIGIEISTTVEDIKGPLTFILRFKDINENIYEKTVELVNPIGSLLPSHISINNVSEGVLTNCWVEGNDIYRYDMIISEREDNNNILSQPEITLNNVSDKGENVEIKSPITVSNLSKVNGLYLQFEITNMIQN